MDRNGTRSDQTTGERHVFVSYARPDESWARAVIDRLEAAGFKTWWDGLIPGGERFGSQIAEALDSASAVVVLWSKNSLKSDWVQDEASVGRDQHRLVPLTIDGSPPPLGFRQIQCIDISRGGPKNGNPAIDRVVAAVGDILGKPQNISVRAPIRVDRRNAILAVGTAVAAAAGFGAWRWLGSGAADNSIAVLPFDNLSGDPKQQYLSDGLSAELRDRLSRNAAIKVVGQASSKALASEEGSGKSIARQLGVANLLDGNVRVGDGMVRIAIELIDGATGFSKWSNSFDRPMTNLLQLQEEVADAVVEALSLRLAGPSVESRKRSGATKNVAAFDAFLRGKELFDSQKDEASDRAALAQFDEAVRRDPDYAAARAARSRAMAVIGNLYGQLAERRQLYDAAIVEANKAIASAPEYADGYVALGYAYYYGKLDIKAAEQPYAKAHAYGSGNADVLSLYALYRARRRQFAEAAPAIERALALDPLNPNLFKTSGRIQFARGDYKAAIASAEKSIEMNPDIGGSNGDVGNAMLMLGNLNGALAAFTREKVGLLSTPGIAIASFRKGDRGAAKAAFDRLVADEGDNGLYQQAQVLAQWGQPDAALDALDKAFAALDSGLAYAFSDPFLAPLRETPRFKALLAKLHFV
ncbi:MAG: TIR domain-containing protein [Sphingomicrobium sp.]